ncbi:MAG: hypothetical protein Q4A62_10290 [Eikenella sp.]|nr:hypothetical protein [Eikenella sp.]
MTFPPKKTALLAFLALVPWTARSETLASVLPDHLPSLEIYAAADFFHTPFPYYLEDRNGFPGLKSRAGRVLVRHITVQDAALRDATLARLRAVPIQPLGRQSPNLPCTERSNPFGAWMLGNKAMLVLWQPVDALKLSGNSQACLQVGDKAHWFQASDTEIWQTLQPLWEK